MHSFPIPILIFLPTFFLFFVAMRFDFKKSFAINIPKLLCTKGKRSEKSTVFIRFLRCSFSLFRTHNHSKIPFTFEDKILQTENQNARDVQIKWFNVTRVQASKVVQSCESEKPFSHSKEVLKHKHRRTNILHCRSRETEEQRNRGTEEMEMEKESENRICIIFVEMHIPLHTKPTWKHVSNGVATYGYEFGARFSIQARTMQQNTKCDLTILIFSVFYMIFCCCVCATSIARCRFFRFISVFYFGYTFALFSHIIVSFQ